MHLGKGIEWGYYFELLKFQIFFGDNIPDVLGVNSRWWIQAYVSRKNESTPPPWAFVHPSLRQVLLLGEATQT